MGVVFVIVWGCVCYCVGLCLLFWWLCLLLYEGCVRYCVGIVPVIMWGCFCYCVGVCLLLWGLCLFLCGAVFVVVGVLFYIVWGLCLLLSFLFGCSNLIM